MWCVVSVGRGLEVGNIRSTCRGKLPNVEAIGKKVYFDASFLS